MKCGLFLTIHWKYCANVLGFKLSQGHSFSEVLFAQLGVFLRLLLAGTTRANSEIIHL